MREATNACGLKGKWCQTVKGTRCEMGEQREMEDRSNVFSIAWKDILMGESVSEQTENFALVVECLLNKAAK